MRRNIFLSIILILLNCTSENSNIKNSNKKSPLTSSEINILAKATKFEDIFDKTSEIQLSTGSDHAISLITDIEIDTKGNYIIADGWQSKAVFIFNSKGDFIKELGQQGQGPGEYSTPESIDINSTGDIFVVDYSHKRINIYDSAYNFKNFLHCEPSVRHFIHLNQQDEIYMYNGALRPFRSNDFDTIYKYNQEGKKITTFARFPQEVKEVKYMAGLNGMTISKDGYIFEMNPLYYNIRKYTSAGEFVTAFSRKTDLFSIETTRGEDAIIVYGPYYLEKGLIIAHVNKHLEFYDTEGNFFVGEIPFSQRIIYTQGNMIFVEQWATEESDNLRNPKIIGYQLKVKSLPDAS